MILRRPEKKMVIICFLATMAFMIICHGFLFLNPSYSHDSLNEIIRDTGTFQTTLGRFAQSAWKTVFGTVTATWFIGMVASVAIAMAAVLLVQILEIRNELSMILLCGILTTNHTLSNSIATYMPWVDTYGGALLLAVAALWLVLRYQWGFLFGIPGVILSIGLYPPYIICIPAIMLLWLIRSLSENRTWKEILFTIIKGIAMLVISYFLYRLLMNLILSSNHLTYSETNNSMARIKFSSFSDLGVLISRTFSTFFDELFVVFNKGSFPLATKVIICVSTVSLIVLCFCNREIPVLNKGIILILCALIPLLFNIQYIVCESATYHTLMIYSIHLASLLPIVLYERVDEEKTESKPVKSITIGIKASAVCALCLLLFFNIRYANNVYTGKYMRERVTLSVMTRIMGAAEQTEGYDPERMPIVILGSLNENPIVAAENAQYEKALANPTRMISITYNIDAYLRYYMGYALVETSGEQKEVIINSEEAAGMNAYPQKGFAKIINDCLVVKISE